MKKIRSIYCGFFEWKNASFVAILVLLSLFFLRVITSTYGLPQYHIDENDIVESSVMLLDGGVDYRIYGYGSIPIYLTALTYRLYAAVVGTSVDRFAERVFFHPTVHYCLARILSNLVILLSSIIILYRCTPYFGRFPSLIAALLVSFPIIGSLVLSYVKVDVFQALFQLLACLSAIRIAVDGRQKHYLFFGAYSALAFNSKPLPGLLVIPVVLYSHYLRCREKASPHRNLLLSLVVFLLVVTLTNPMLVTKLDEVFSYQRMLLLRDPFRDFPKGYELNHLLSQIGFLTGSFLLFGWLLSLRRPTLPSRVLTFFVGFYFLAFAFFPVRPHFYVALIPPLSILLGEGIWSFSKRFDAFRYRALFCFLVLLVLLGETVNPLVKRAVGQQFVEAPRKGRTSALSSLEWIESNIPSGSSVLYYGKYPVGPKIISDSKEDQAFIGQYFMYGRNSSRYFTDRFSSAYDALLGRPRYKIFYFGGLPSRPNSYGTTNIPRKYLQGSFDAQVLPLLEEFGIEYVITVGSLGDLSWLSTLSRIYVLRNISVFRVLHKFKHNFSLK